MTEEKISHRSQVLLPGAYILWH